MTKKKTSVVETPPESVVETPPTITIEESNLSGNTEEDVFENLRGTLAEIRKNNEILGFILKNSAQAVVDINNAEELADLALLASQLFDSSEKLIDLFHAGTMKTVVLEGAKIKMICLCVGENQLGLIMEKGSNPRGVLKRILAQTEK
jgi:predicted regulator of Ras-like GTPase activity (Roadblock/LC7/MglB family)